MTVIPVLFARGSLPLDPAALAFQLEASVRCRLLIGICLPIYVPLSARVLMEKVKAKTSEEK